MITIEDEVIITNKLSQWKNGLSHDTFKEKPKKSLLWECVFLLALCLGMYLIFYESEYAIMAIVCVIGIIFNILFYKEKEWYIDKDGIYILVYQSNNCKALKSMKIYRWDDFEELTLKTDSSSENPESDYSLIIRRKDGSREILTPPVNKSILKEILPKYINDTPWFKGL